MEEKYIYRERKGNREKRGLFAGFGQSSIRSRARTAKRKRRHASIGEPTGSYAPSARAPKNTRAEPPYLHNTPTRGTQNHSRFVQPSFLHNAAHQLLRRLCDSSHILTRVRPNPDVNLTGLNVSVGEEHPVLLVPLWVLNEVILRRKLREDR